MPEPGDVPSGRPASLDRLDALVGEWKTEASFEAGYFGPGSPAVTFRGGRTTFHWLEGKSFLIQRVTMDDPGFPTAIMIIGPGDTPDTFKQHFYDSRGVERLYMMTLDESVWRLWRDAPGFSQRYVGRFSEGGKTITGAWEKSADGKRWEHDFSVQHMKVE